MVCGSLKDHDGAIAQLGERLICIQEVVGSIPIVSTIITLNTHGKEISLKKLCNFLKLVSQEKPVLVHREEDIIFTNIKSIV